MNRGVGVSDQVGICIRYRGQSRVLGSRSSSLMNHTYRTNSRFVASMFATTGVGLLQVFAMGDVWAVSCRFARVSLRLYRSSLRSITCRACTRSPDIWAG